jgi:PKD repeat protein
LYGAKAGTSKNTATGPAAAHIYETAGTYTATLTINNGTTSTTTTQTITVTAADTQFVGAATVCISTTTSFTGCPAGATQVPNIADLPTALGYISSTVKRVLLHRGETFTASTASNITQAGPGLIGAYGTGAKPFVQVTGDGHSTIAFNTGDDWRVMDMAFDAIGTTSSNGIRLLDRKQITILRVDVTNTDAAFATSDASIPNADQLTIQDSTSNGINNGAGHVNVWILSERFAFQGNHIDNTRPATGVAGGEHVLRAPKITKGVISNNDIWNPQNFDLSSGKHCIDLHSASRGVGNPAPWDGTYSEQVVIADNILQGGVATPWDIHIGSQATSHDERLRNIIVERNYFSAAAGNNLAVNIVNTVGTTVRNNIMNIGTSGTGMGVSVNPGELGPPSDLTYIYNNTFYSTYVPNNNRVLAVSTSVDSLTTTIRNNVLVAPNDTNSFITYGNGLAVISDHNLVAYNQPASNVFVSATPTLPAHFALKAGSPAIGAGTPVPVWDDYIKATRVSPWSVGAYKF